jgi:hypothetical protein
MEINFSNLFAVLIFWFFCIKTKEQRRIIGMNILNPYLPDGKAGGVF